MTGIVYLLHFERPYKHAKHYIGYTDKAELDQRILQHGTAHGSRLMQVVCAEGIRFCIARTWKGSRKKERALKNQGGASRICPCCKNQF